MIAEIAATISCISLERPSAFAAITVGAQIDGRGQKPMDQIAVGALDLFSQVFALVIITPVDRGAVPRRID